MKGYKDTVNNLYDPTYCTTPHTEWVSHMPPTQWPDSPDGGDPGPGGTWALGAGGELRGWKAEQSDSLSPYLSFHISTPFPVPPPVAEYPFPLLLSLSLPGFPGNGVWRGP